MLRTIFQLKTNVKSVQLIKEETSKMHIYGKLLKIIKAHIARKTVLIDSTANNVQKLLQKVLIVSAADNVQSLPVRMHAQEENCAVVKTTHEAQ